MKFVISRPSRLRIRDMLFIYILAELAAAVLMNGLKGAATEPTYWIYLASRSAELLIFIGMLSTIPSAREMAFTYAPIERDENLSLRVFMIAIQIILGVAISRILLEWMTLVIMSFTGSTAWVSNLAQSAPSDYRVITAIFFAPLVEEFIYRRILLILLVPRWGTAKALLVSSAIFAISHRNFFVAFTLGVILGLIYLRTGKIWLAVLGHAVANFINFLMYRIYFPVSLVKGEGSYSILFILLTVAAISLLLFLWNAWRQLMQKAGAQKVCRVSAN